MIAIDSSKQKVFDADPKPMQQINFIGNLERDKNGNTAIFFIIKESEKTVSEFPEGTVKVL